MGKKERKEGKNVPQLAHYRASDVKKILLCVWAFTMCGSIPPPPQSNEKYGYIIYG